MPKDACYHKVKARYSVFPSAYASGAIAKCRKVGAANYGNKSKKKKKTAKAANGGYGKDLLAQLETKPKRPTNKKGVARGCGAVLENKRKVTKVT